MNLTGSNHSHALGTTPWSKILTTIDQVPALGRIITQARTRIASRRGLLRRPHHVVVQAFDAQGAA